MIRKISQYLLVFGIGLGLFVGLEVLLRFFAPEGTEPDADLDSPPSPRVFAYEFDKEYGQRLKKNAEGAFVRSKINGGETISWRSNAHRFRGDALRTDVDLRIMVYGDSNIQAVFSTLESTFPAKLAHYLQPQIHKTVEVINAGIVGYGPDQSYLKFADEVDLYRPDLVVFHVFADNDFGDLVRNQLFVFDALGKLRRAPPRIKPSDLPLEAASRPAGIKHKLANLSLVRSARWARQAIAGQQTKNLEGRDWLQYFHKEDRMAHTRYTDRSPAKLPFLHDHYDLDVATSPDSASARLKRRLMEAVLQEASDFARSKQVEFVVVIQPSVVDLTENFWVSYEDLAAYPAYRPNNLTGAVETICRRLNIPYVNLFDAFRRSSPGDLFFFKNNNHWNDAGQDLAARVAAGSLAKHIATRSSDRHRATRPEGPRDPTDGMRPAEG